MSYTAPQYVDTKEQAILALASTIKGEAVTGGDGSVNRALDILADVLAEEDVTVPQTDAGAILALADYVSGGGGSSDFTTAHVTFTNSSSGNINPELLKLCTYAEAGEFSSTCPMPHIMRPSSSIETDAVLFKGRAMLMLPAEAASTSGAIESMDDGLYMITGDCSITL